MLQWIVTKAPFRKLAGAVTTALRFIACFAPAVAVFALTLEWAYPASYKSERHIASGLHKAHLQQCAVLSTTNSVSPYINPSIVFSELRFSCVFSELRFSCLSNNQGLSSLNPFESGTGKSVATVTSYFAKNVYTANSEHLSFDDRLTRSAWVTIGLGLVTLTGGFGILLFQKRIK